MANSVDELKALVNTKLGFARPNRFMVDFVLPRGVQYNSDETDGEILFEEEIQRLYSCFCKRTYYDR